MGDSGGGRRATDGSRETEACRMGCWGHSVGGKAGTVPHCCSTGGAALCGSLPHPRLPEETPFLPALAAPSTQPGDGPSLGLTFLFCQMGE